MPLTPDPAALAARCLELSPDGPLALGLSGGGDSVALSLILARAARQSGRDVHCLIVDHGLRPESGAEAQTAAARARALGAEARILTWTDPRKGQAAARAARHRLLAGACARIGARTLFLAHTLDDRLETLRMRLVRPGSWRGAAGMAVRDPSPVWPEGADLALARPLLDQRRAALRDFLKAEGADWIEDPSNADPAYERVRVRAAALDPGEEAALLGLSDAAQALEAQTRRAAAALVDRTARLEPWGGLALDPGPFETAPALI
ncbi:tRNA lysidine(34) synthetase TilS, partial [Glycocaulis profundi]